MKTKEEIVQRALELKTHQIQARIIEAMMVGTSTIRECFSEEEIPLFMDELIKILSKEFIVFFNPIFEGSSTHELSVSW